jgi:hypothetical protein
MTAVSAEQARESIIVEGRQRKRAKVRGDGEKRQGESLKLQSKILLCIMCVGTALTRACIGLAAADAVPTLNVAPTCESEGRKQMALAVLPSRRARGAKRKRDTRWRKIGLTIKRPTSRHASDGSATAAIGAMSSCNRASNPSSTRAKFARPMPRVEATRRRTRRRSSEILEVQGAGGALAAVSDHAARPCTRLR